MSKTSLILAIIQAALTGLASTGVGTLPAEVGLAFLGILKNGMAVYQAETGQPLDLTKIPIETQVP